MVIHRLADCGLIDYDEQVATYWQEFAAAGKGGITVRELLSHRAGLYDVQAVARNAEDLMDHIGMERRLAASTPEGPPGRPAYHAITFGWLASGPGPGGHRQGDARARPKRACRTSRHAGLEIGTGDGPTRPAEMVGRSLRFYTAFGIAATPLLGWLPVTRAGFRALHAPGFEELCRGPEPCRLAHRDARGERRTQRRRSLPSVRPPGQRRSRPRRHGPSSQPTPSRALGRVQTRGVDRVLGVRMRWRLGFHHAFALGQPAPRALGHYGFGGSGGWGDPDTGVSFGFVSSHIGNFTTAIGDLGILRLTAVARACAARAL